MFEKMKKPIKMIELEAYVEAIGFPEFLHVEKQPVIIQKFHLFPIFYMLGIHCIQYSSAYRKKSFFKKKNKKSIALNTGI